MRTPEVECDRLGAVRVGRSEPAPPTSAAFVVVTDPDGVGTSSARRLLAALSTHVDIRQGVNVG